MIPKHKTVLVGIVLIALLEEISGNGRLLVPPQRSSLWRDPAFHRNRKVFKNYDDHTLNCGGFWKMHENDGKCGLCGDAWDDEEPRANEAGGMYARGIIGRTYSTDKRFIDALVQVTASISGYFEFNICPNDDVKKRVSRECLDQFPLRILSKDRSISYGRRYFPDIQAGMAGIVELSLEIPDGLECTQCVLQWRWHGANNYGVCRNGKWGKGCGEQPEIYNCADIAILPEGATDKKDDKRERRPVVTTATPKSSSSTTTTQKPTTLSSSEPESTTIYEVKTTIIVSSTVTTAEAETSPLVPETTTLNNTKPEPEPEQKTQTQQDMTTYSSSSQTTSQSTALPALTESSSTADSFRPTTGPLDSQETRTTIETIQDTTVHTTAPSPVSRSDTLDHSTASTTNTTVVTDESTTVSISGDNNTTEQSSVESAQISTESSTQQKSTAFVDQTTEQTTSLPDTSTIKVYFSTIEGENITTSTTRTTVFSSTEIEQSTKEGKPSTLKQDQSTKHMTEQTTTSFTERLSTQTPALPESPTTSLASETTHVSEGLEINEKIKTLTETNETTKSVGIKKLPSTTAETEIRFTTDPVANASVGNEKSETTTSMSVNMNGTTDTQTETTTNIDTLSRILTSTHSEQSSVVNTQSPVSTDEKENVTTPSSITQTSPSDGASLKTKTTTMPENKSGGTETPNKLPNNTIESSTESIRPLVNGSIITNLDNPTAVDSQISLFDILKELSKLENISSNDLINAISGQSNVSSSTANVNISNPLADENVIPSIKNVTTTGSTTLQTTNDIDESPAATRNNPQSESISTATTTMIPAATSDVTSIQGFESNVVTAKTTRIVQPQGGRFGGGINKATLKPVEQIVNINFNIPGGDANIEKERNKAL